MISEEHETHGLDVICVIIILGADPLGLWKYMGPASCAGAVAGISSPAEPEAVSLPPTNPR
jgi:hypothetical protein